MELEETTGAKVLRERAIKRLKKRRDFAGHLLVYALVNTFIVLIWFMSGSNGFFWPVFPIVGWGIGVVMNAWDVYRNDEFDEVQIRREMDRLQRTGGVATRPGSR
jgi:2TM domain